MTGGAERHDGGVRFWCFAAVGGTICLYGLHGLVDALGGLTSRQFLQWFVGADIAHDFLIAPIAALIGVAVVRRVPAVARAHVRGGLFASAIVLAIAWAPLHRYGHASARGNSSVEPLDYSTAVLTALALVWIAVGVWLGLTLGRRHAPRR